MWEVSAPAARMPVRGGLAAGAIALLLAVAGCRSTDAPPRVGRVAQGAEVRAASGDVTGTVDTACEIAAWVVSDALGVEAEQVDTPLSDLLGEADQPGCRLTAVGSFADLPEDAETPVDLLWDSFEEGGWHEDLRYAADTEATSAVGMWKSGVLCVMGAMWAAAGEYDEEYEPTEDELRYDVAVECRSAEAPPIPLLGSIA